MARVQKSVDAKGQVSYAAKWRKANGKDTSKRGFRTKKEASAYAVARENEKARGIDFDPSAGKVLFRHTANAWLESCKADLKETTWAGHKGALAPAAQRQGDMKTLGIDAVFGDYPINAIRREFIQEWVNKLVAAKKKPSTVRHAFFIVRMVLAQAVADNKLAANPADYVKIPGEHSSQGDKAGVVDDFTQFLSAAQVSALVDATPWPYNVLVHLAAWAGPRAAELGGLQVGDVLLPPKQANPNAPEKSGALRILRSARAIGPEMKYLPTKSKGNRKVPLRGATVGLLREYLAMHPRRDEPTAPLFPNMTLAKVKPTGVRATNDDGTPDTRAAKQVANRQAAALADLTVAEAEKRIELDWTRQLRHPTFYKAVYRPAVLRANRVAVVSKNAAGVLPADLRFHALRHTYASLCAAAGTSARQVAKFMGHANTTTTEHIYTHLFDTDDFSTEMSALDALDQNPLADNVIALRHQG